MRGFFTASNVCVGGKGPSDPKPFGPDGGRASQKNDRVALNERKPIVPIFKVSDGKPMTLVSDGKPMVNRFKVNR